MGTRPGPRTASGTFAVRARDSIFPTGRGRGKRSISLSDHATRHSASSKLWTGLGFKAKPLSLTWYERPSRVAVTSTTLGFASTPGARRVIHQRRQASSPPSPSPSLSSLSSLSSSSSPKLLKLTPLTPMLASRLEAGPDIPSWPL